MAVASPLAGSEYGHPHRETLALQAARRISLLRTDQVGTIRLESDGQAWQVVGQSSSPRGAPVGAAKSKSAAADSSARVSLNNASQVKLEALPGIGAVLARRIIEGRPYRSVEDLRSVSVIGAKRLERVLPLVKVE
jgi:DNA uptake protein ComE-like DNA-binding protein